MNIVYVTAIEIVAINEVVVSLSGGSVGLREPGLLESTALKPQAIFDGTELYPDIYLKAAVLYESIVNYHVFIDGNKRTGVATLARFLYINGYSLAATDQELVEYTVKIATHTPDLADIAIWIKKHSKKDRV